MSSGPVTFKRPYAFSTSIRIQAVHSIILTIRIEITPKGCTACVEVIRIIRIEESAHNRVIEAGPQVVQPGLFSVPGFSVAGAQGVYAVRQTYKLLLRLAHIVTVNRSLRKALLRLMHKLLRALKA